MGDISTKASIVESLLRDLTQDLIKCKSHLDIEPIGLMKILLVSMASKDFHTQMNRFSEMMQAELSEQGIDIDTLKSDMTDKEVEEQIEKLGGKTSSKEVH